MSRDGSKRYDWGRELTGLGLMFVKISIITFIGLALVCVRMVTVLVQCHRRRLGIPCAK